MERLQIWYARIMTLSCVVFELFPLDCHFTAFSACAGYIFIISSWKDFKYGMQETLPYLMPTLSYFPLIVIFTVFGDCPEYTLSSQV